MTPVSHGKPCAGNPHARFDEGASASEEPRRNALLHIYKGLHFRGGRLIAAMMGAFLLIIAHSALAEELSESSADDVNYILNGDFAEATIPVNSGNYGGGANITVPSWEFGTTAGLAKGNSAWIITTHSDPYAAYMQRELKTTYIQQTFTLPVAGRYRFSFYYKARDTAAMATGYQLAVSMDGVEFKSVTTASTSWRLATVDIELTEGDHVLKFYAKRQLEEQSLDISVIIDDVSLRKITASDNLISNGDFSDVAISANSGSWGVGSDNASAQSWEIGNSSGFTTANTVWRNPLYSDPYAALLHYELTASTLSQQVWVPSDGRYLFSFWYTARNRYQLGFRMAVSMDGTDIAKAMTATYDWSQCMVEIELTAGFHDLKFYGERGYSSSSEQTEGDVTIIIDDVSLKMSSDIKSAVWTGQGEAANVFGDPANWQCYDGNGNQLEGKVPPSGVDVTLAADADWRQVPAGSLAMSSVNLDGHHLQIAGNEALGSIVSVRSGDNCVANGDFSEVEIPADVNSGVWGKSEQVTVSSWGMTSNVGVTRQSSDWTGTVFSQPYSAFIQGERESITTLSQKLTVPSDGLYRLSFWYKGRDVHVYTLGHNLAAAIDGQEIAVATTTSYSDWMRCSAEVELSAGEHTLELYGRGRWTTDAEYIDRSVIIDNVSLYKSSASRITVEVPEGVLFDNSRLKLEGALTFVKKGLGTFVASAGLQTYDGGTLVEAGVLRLNALGSTIPLGATDGTSPIRIAAGATFDFNGKYEMDAFHFILDGGTIANYGSDIATDTSLGRSALHYATLTADSYLNATGNFLLRGGSGKAINLGGNTLTATLADGKTLFAGNVISNGTVRFESANAIFYALDGFSTTDADFDISAQLAIHAPIEVRNWTVRHEGEAGLSDSTVTVGGVFSPVSDYFCDTQLADGATLDLSGRDTALDVKSLDTANEKDYRLSFADNATILVYFGERRIRSEVKVVAWTAETKPTNLAMLRFKVSPENRYRQRLVVKEDGIYAAPADGMMIIVR